MAFVDDHPGEARVVRVLLTTALSALAVGGVFGLIQSLHRTDYLRFIDSSTYYTVLTAHGVLLVLVFTTFFILGLFTWAISQDLDGLGHPKLTWGWVALTQLGTLMAAIAIFAGFTDAVDMSADVLYTHYAPMQAHPLFYIGLAVLIIGTWVAGFDWIRAWLRWKRDHPDERVPLRTYMVLMTMALWYISTMGVAIEVVFFLIPWSLGIIETVDPLLTRTLFWFFGHPVVYFWLLPAYVVWYTVFPSVADGRLFSDPLARVVFILFLLTSIPVGIHHQYVDPGIAEGYKYVAMSNTMFVLLPSLLTVFTVIASIEYGARRRGGTGLFGWLRNLPWGRPEFTGVAFAGILFAAGGFSGIINAGMNINYLI
ncbi:MAG: cbb3-type cytochrome c oxidase subunit I, partial [Halobacteriota archaeon]